MPIIEIKEVNLITEWVYDIHNNDCCVSVQIDLMNHPLNQIR